MTSAGRRESSVTEEDLNATLKKNIAEFKEGNTPGGEWILDRMSMAPLLLRCARIWQTVLSEDDSQNSDLTPAVVFLRTMLDCLDAELQ